MVILLISNDTEEIIRKIVEIASAIGVPKLNHKIERTERINQNCRYWLGDIKSNTISIIVN